MQHIVELSLQMAITRRPLTVKGWGVALSVPVGVPVSVLTAVAVCKTVAIGQGIRGYGLRGRWITLHGTGSPNLLRRGVCRSSSCLGSVDHIMKTEKKL